MSKDFIVNVAKETRPISQKGFGLILILGTSKEHPYTTYNEISDVAKDFGVDTKEYKIASRLFQQNPKPSQISIAGKAYSEVDTPEVLVSALEKIVESNNEWYFLTSTENKDDVVEAISSWIDTQEKLYFTTTQNLDLSKRLESENTVVMYHNDEEAYIAEGLTAIGATRDVGGITFKFKTVIGVKECDITSTDLKILHESNGFSYIKKFGVLQTTEGITTSGEYIDVVMASHFIKAKAEEKIAMLAVNNDKIPYDNRGISMLISALEETFKEGVRLGAILTDENGNGVYEVKALTREELPDNDIANRIYSSIKGTAKLSGAIHSGNLNIILTY